MSIIYPFKHAHKAYIAALGSSAGMRFVSLQTGKMIGGTGEMGCSIYKKITGYVFAIVRATHLKAFWCCPSRQLFKRISAVSPFMASWARPRIHMQKDRG